MSQFQKTKVGMKVKKDEDFYREGYLIFTYDENINGGSEKE